MDEERLQSPSEARARKRGRSAGQHGIDQLTRKVVKACKGKAFTTATVNACTRKMATKSRSDKKHCDVVREVVDNLVRGRVVEEVREQGPARRGPPVKQFRWRPWAEIMRDPASEPFRRRLGLVEADFAASE